MRRDTRLRSDHDRLQIRSAEVPREGRPARARLLRTMTSAHSRFVRVTVVVVITLTGGGVAVAYAGPTPLGCATAKTLERATVRPVWFASPQPPGHVVVNAYVPIFGPGLIWGGRQRYVFFSVASRAARTWALRSRPRLRTRIWRTSAADSRCGAWPRSRAAGSTPNGRPPVAAAPTSPMRSRAARACASSSRFSAR